MRMDWNTFEERVFSGGRDEYVADEIASFFAREAEYRVIDSSALVKSEFGQTEFVSVSLPESADNYTDEELIEKVREAVLDGGHDIQKYQFRDGADAPRVVEVWRHGSGYSAFALAQ